MLKRSVTLFTAILFAAASFYGHTQQSSEIFIPIGKSPGISKTDTIIGEINSIDSQNGVITITDSSGTFSVKVKNDTKIWLDKSKMRKTNEVGKIADCKPGRSVEVKYKEAEKLSSVTAEWIKVEVTN